MKQTNFFDISVPELGDRPDITQVSNAISNLEDALAGTMEYMNASINNKILTLTSATRTTKRTGYHTGLTCVFTSGAKIDVGGITSIIVDNLPAVPAELKFIIDVDDSAIVTFDGTKFAFKHAPMPRSNAIDSSSEHFVATSRAVKTLNDNKAEKTIQIVAGNGLTGGGDLTSNKTINVVSADAGIIVNADNIKLNVVNAINSADAIRPASANSAKTAYDRGTEGLNKANEAISLANSNNTAIDNKKVNRAGDTMTGNLILNKLLVMEDGQSIRFKKKDGSANQWMLGTLDDKLFVGETTTPAVIRASSNPTVKVGSAGETTIYHTGNKPTKTDVGLSSVSNFPITSSVSDASNEKYATAGAVKQAYDRASSGINDANTKVSKSGDTMTGTLTVPSFVSTGNYGLCFDDNTSDTKAFIRAKRKDSSEQNWVFGMHNATKRFELVGGQLSDWYLSIGGTHVTAAKFLGPLQGNADTSTKLATARQINGTNFDGTANITTANWGTARNLTIGNTAKSVNGSGNVSWSLSEIGAVNKAGDTMTGALAFDTTTGEKIIKGNDSSTSPYIYMNKNSSGTVGLYSAQHKINVWTYPSSENTLNLGVPLKASGITASSISTTSGITSGTSFLSNTKSATTYAHEAMGNSSAQNSGDTNYLRKFRSETNAIIWHETVKGGTYRLSTGTTPSTTQLELNSGNLTVPSNITSRGSGVVVGIRLGTAVSRQIWNSTQSATEDKGYVTVAVRNNNGDEVPDNELRRPLQALVNGSWVTVSTV